MVCNRCLMAVEEVFENLKIETFSVELGEVETKNNLSKSELKKTLCKFLDLGYQVDVETILTKLKEKL